MSTTKPEPHGHPPNESNPSLSAPPVKPDETRAGVLVDWREAGEEKSPPENSSDTLRDGK